MITVKWHTRENARGIVDFPLFFVLYRNRNIDVELNGTKGILSHLRTMQSAREEWENERNVEQTSNSIGENECGRGIQARQESPQKSKKESQTPKTQNYPWNNNIGDSKIFFYHYPCTIIFASPRTYETDGETFF